MLDPPLLLVDTDPVFTQVRHLTDPASRATALQHTAFFSFGENIRSDAGRIPDDQLDWLPTRQPVVLDAWPVTPGPRKLALGSDAAPRQQLLAAGWSLRNPLEVTRDPSSYQHYIQQSKAEFSVAKHGYVVSHSGWFSERSACYMASGRPVLVQETGFSEWLESGAGVVAFSTPEEAIAGIDLINSDYENHSRRARELARASFDAGDVLASLIRRIFSGSQKNDRPGASD